MSSPTLPTPADAARPRPRFRPPSAAGLLVTALSGANRSIALGLLASAIGLGVAAVGVFHPAPRELTAVPPGDVALVNQQPILMSDFIDETQSATGGGFAEATPAQRAATLRTMIGQELLVQRALALNLPEEDTNIRQALADGVDNQISSSVLANPPTEEALRRYFASRRDAYAGEGSMDLTDLVLRFGGFENVDQSLGQAQADAAQAVYDLRSGVPVAQVEQHFGAQDSGKVSGETFDFAAQIHLGPKLFAVAQSLGDGQVSEPVVDADGVHVLVMHHRAAPAPVDFDSVRNNVYSDYIKAEEKARQQSNLNDLRSNAQILLAPGQGE